MLQASRFLALRRVCGPSVAVYCAFYFSDRNAFRTAAIGSSIITSSKWDAPASIHVSTFTRFDRMTEAFEGVVVINSPHFHDQT
jgi:hypothetical protein